MHGFPKLDFRLFPVWERIHVFDYLFMYVFLFSAALADYNYLKFFHMCSFGFCSSC